MRQILDFYYPLCMNLQDGGYFNEFRDDGRVSDRSSQHLVSTTRFIFNISHAARLFGRAEYGEAIDHGLRFLQERHQDHESGGYFWVLQNGVAVDASKQCYGHAFVLLAFASAAMAGRAGSTDSLYALWDLLEQRFWSPAHNLYCEEFTRDWRPVSRYRGQNANMHMTEAMIAAYEATNDMRFIDRAETLAHRICVDLAAKTNGLVWEHFHEDWSVDLDYNKDDPKNLFRPYGHLPGHFTEWAKLLLILERYRQRDWMLPTAIHLYEAARLRSADIENGGMHYAFRPDGSVCDFDKYHWVHCETLAAAACLAVRTGNRRYWQDYDHLWGYSWAHLIDHEYGGWYRVLTPDGRRYDDLKSPPAKTDYHPFGACYEILRTTGALEAASRR
jgi:mannose/cellobiose epimerase-like protein (N-acyl-D-glucosamine 2-epimerase family)